MADTDLSYTRDNIHYGTVPVGSAAESEIGTAATLLPESQGRAVDLHWNDQDLPGA